MLTTNLKSEKKVSKRATGTRWSSKYNACCAFTMDYKMHGNIDQYLEENESEKSENRIKAQGLQEKLSQFEVLFVAVIWTTILERFQKTSKTLQAVSTNVGVVINLYNSLIDFVTDLRTDTMFNK